MSLLFLVIPLLAGEHVRPTTQVGLLLAACLTGGLAVASILFQSRLTTLFALLIQDAREQRRDLSTYRVSHIDVWVLVILMAVGLVLRALFLTQPVRTDEAVTYLHYASRSLPLALSNYSAPNNHLLHTFLVWISVHIFGNTEIALRLPAFIMGVLLIPVTYGVGRTLSNRRAGLLAAGLVIVSSVLIEYSTNARGYTLQCVLFGISIALAFHARRSLSPLRWGLLALVLALGFFTVPTMLYPFGGLMLWLLVDIGLAGRPKQISPLPFLRAWLACGLLTLGLTFVFYSPVLIVSGLTAIIGNQYVQPFTFDVFVQHLPNAAAHLWAHWHTSIPPVIAAIMGLGALIGLVWGQRTRAPLLLACALWSIAALCLQRVIPFERNLLPFFPLYFVTVSSGLVWVWDRWAGRRVWIGWLMGGLLIVGLGANIILTRSPYISLETGTFRDAKVVVQDLQSLLTPGDHVYLEHPSGDSLAYYAKQAGLDWDLYAGDAPVKGDLYLIINTEYPQTLESVAGWNALALNRYTVTTIKSYAQGALVRLAHK